MNNVHGSNKRAEKRQRRRQEILANALAIVVEQGIQELTVHALARRMNSAVGAMYRYFDGKGALLRALQELAVEGFAEHLERELSGTGLERVRSAFFVWHRFAEAEPALFALLDGALSDPRNLLTEDAALEIDGRLGEVLGACGATLAQAAAEGLLEPGDAEQRTYALWAAMHGVEHFRKRDSYARMNSDQVREELLATLLRGWGAELQAG